MDVKKTVKRDCLL